MIKSPTAPPLRKGAVFLGAALLFLLAAAVFYRVVHFEFVNWDDDLYVYQNESIRALTFENIKIWFTRPFVALYVPLPLFSYALDYSFNGNDPSIFHFTNILFHSLNGVLVFLIFLLMSRDALLAFLGAAVFLIHPAQVESVCWISQRKNLLFGFFFLAGFLLRLFAFTRERRGSWLLISTVCLVLSLLSKATAVVIPLILMAHEFFFRGARKREGFLIGLFLLVPAAAMGAFTLTLYPDILKKFTLEGAAAIYARASASLMIYLQNTFWPFSLNIHYDQETHENFFRQGGFFFYMLLPALAAVFAAAAKKRSPAGFWLAWTAFFLLPVVNIFYVPAGDRHLYIPLIGVLGVIIFVFRGRGRRAKAALLALMVVLLLPLTAARIEVWRNSETFWKYASRQGPFAYTADMHLAGYYEDRKDYARAAELYWEVARQANYLPYAYLNLYGILRMQGDQGGMEKLSLLFNQLYTPHYRLGDIYGQLLARKANPAEVRETLEMLMNSRYLSAAEREQLGR